MNQSTISDLLDVSDASRKIILNKYQLTEDDVKNNSEKILEDFKDQPFMRKVTLDKRQVENLLIQNKGSFEKTKHCIRNLYFLKLALPEIFTGRDPQLPELRETLKALSFCIQYPLSKSGERYMCMVFKEQADKLEYNAFFKIFYMELDMKMRYDFAGDFVFVIDVRQLTKELIDKSFSNFRLIALSVYASQQAYGQTYKSFHFLCPPASASEFMQSLHNIVEKNTVFIIHEDLASLHRSVDVELLPGYLGGNQNTIDNVQEKWLKKANSVREWFLEDDKKFTEF